jgi:NADPH-dependent curcumin reductase CurA
VLPLLNQYARVPVCGLIAQYNSAGHPDGPDRFPATMRQILVRSLTLRGFIVREFWDQWPTVLNEVSTWIAEGRVRFREDIVKGLHSAPEALIGMLEGKNFGKLIVEIDED